jgi:D-glycero-alpha-D-manno-heptose-7-phosphate kinase
LGSSSSFTVGLIHALSGLRGQMIDKLDLAKNAIHIEQNLLQENVGSQDQISAAYGGFNMFTFNCDGTVNAEPLVDIDAPGLTSNLLLVYSGRGRSANAILQKQQNAVGQIDKFNLIKKGRDKAFEGRRYLKEGDHDSFGQLLHDAWMDKKSLVKEISETYFDDIYTKAYNAGSLGGKLLGAGGGGVVEKRHVAGAASGAGSGGHGRHGRLLGDRGVGAAVRWWWAKRSPAMPS